MQSAAYSVSLVKDGNDRSGLSKHLIDNDHFIWSLQDNRCCTVLYICVCFDIQVHISRNNRHVDQQTDSACRVLRPERSQLSHWSNTCQVERDASVRQWGIGAIVPSSVILEEKTSPVLAETVATAGTLTSHANFNRTCVLTAGAKPSTSFAL